MSSIAAAAAAEVADDLGDVARAFGRTGAELARRWATRRLGAVEHYARILSDYGAGRLTGRGAAGAYARLATEEAARYPGELIGLAGDYVAAVAKIAGVPVKTRIADSASATGPVVDVDLSAGPGQLATRSFVFENPHDTEATVAFVASPYADGERDLKVAPRFTPAAFVLPAHGEQTVTVTTRVDKRYFKAGRSYSAHAAVEGFDAMILRIHLSATEAG